MIGNTHPTSTFSQDVEEMSSDAQDLEGGKTRQHTIGKAKSDSFVQASMLKSKQPHIAATLSETEENVTTFVTPVNRSGRNQLANESKSSRDSSEVRPGGLSRARPFGDDNNQLLPTTDRPSKTCSTTCGVKMEKGSKSYQAYLAYLTLGVIYGDIGTSPLYAITSVFPAPPTSTEVVLGGLSLVLWTLIIVVLFKYVCFILTADDFGEGGTFALYSLLNRGLKKHIKSPETYKGVSLAFSIVAIIGVSAVLADGILTPAISVMGAIDGLKFVSSDVDQSVVVGVSCAILFLFFLPQRFGTSRVSKFFSPIIIVWYGFLVGIGIYNISRFPGILEAFNPVYAARFLGGNYEGFGGWTSLGSAFLVVTGSEALYADLGHFNAKAIRTSAVLIVLPSLIICYCGQCAALVLDPSAQRNAMYLTLPPGLLYPMIVLAVFAAIIASQAMVTATFSVVAQAIRLQYFPRLTVKHTDRLEFGQVYVPEINWFLMVLVLIVVAGYRDVAALGYAYGVTVSLAFFITTFLFSFVIVYVFERNIIFAILFFLIFGFVDGNLLAANLTKFVTGGWFSVVIALVISAVLFTWRLGRHAMVEEQRNMTRPMSELYKAHEEKDDTGSIVQFTHAMNLPTPLLICFSSSPDSIPAAFVHFYRRLPVRPRNLVFVTVQAVNVAFVEQHLELKPVEEHENVYRLIVHHGYCERPPFAHKIVAFIIQMLDCYPAVARFFPPPTNAELVRFTDPTIIVGHDHVVAKPNSSLRHRIFVDMFQVLYQFSRSPVVTLAIPPENALQVGLQVPI